MSWALVLSVLLFSGETLNIKSCERGRLNSFSTRTLCRISSYRWDNFASNYRVLRVTGMIHVTCMIRQPQLRQFSHFRSFPGSDLVSRVIFEEIIPDWKRLRGRPSVFKGHQRSSPDEMHKGEYHILMSFLWNYNNSR